MKKYCAGFLLLAALLTGLNYFVAENAALVNPGDVINGDWKKTECVGYTTREFTDFAKGVNWQGTPMSFGNMGWRALLDRLRGKTLYFEHLANVRPSAQDKYLWCEFRVLEQSCNLVLLSQDDQVVLVVKSAELPQKVLIPKEYAGKLIGEYKMLLVTDGYATIWYKIQIVEPL